VLKNRKLLILVLLVCSIVAVSGCINNENTSSSDTSSTNGSNGEDVMVTVNYNGNWGGSASGEFGYRELSGNGEQTINLGKISGVLTVSTWTTAGAGPMSLKITKGDQTLGEQSNSYPSATITITV